MNLFIAVITFVTSLLATVAGTELFRRNSLRRNWLDHPNERSSHVSPTPRGAGLVIVSISLIAYLAIGLYFSSAFSWGYLIGALLVAGISWLDDLYSLPFFIRLVAHFAAAILVIFDAGYWTLFGFSNEQALSLGGLGAIITAVWIVWVINAYNFMDGIDGIAGVQALVTAAAWAVLSINAPGALIYALVLAGSSFGFLIHNWHPARVFMGDVGSAFLGYTFAAFGLLFSHETRTASAILPIISILVLWPFLLDTILTMANRAWNGEKFWQAHRKHLYQRLVVAGFSHPFVTIAYGAFAIMSSTAALVIYLTPGSEGIFQIAILIAASVTFAVIIRRKTSVISVS
jgi:Fuc2NAc and GlcNAc transferase